MELNDGNIKKIRGLILFTVVAAVAGVNYQSLFRALAWGVGIAFPFLLGAALAFILNVPMRRIEKLLPMKEGGKMKRPLSLVLALTLVGGVILLAIFVVMPQLFQTIISLQSSIPVFLGKVQKAAEDLFYKYPEIVQSINDIQIDWEQTLQNLVGFLTSGAGTVLSSTVTAAVSIVNGFTTFGIALIFSMYILLQKETLGRQAVKLLRAVLPEQAAAGVQRVAGLAERTFSHFLTGQCVEAMILGTMFFVTLLALRMPYALLIGVLIAFTALIPIFGAFIGCAVGVFLMLMVSPAKALIFVVIFFVLQQIEGNLIYPHVVGNSVGLPSIWVLVAVTIGGSAMGIPGMLIFIPLCSVLYSLLRGWVNKRLERKAGVKRKATAGKSRPAGG